MDYWSIWCTRKIITMAQRTAMNELLLWVRKTLPMDLDYPRMIEEKIESLIPKEKEQIIDAYIEASPRFEDITKEAAEQYYNETFGK